MTKPRDLDDRLPIVPFCPWRCPHCGRSQTKTYGQRGRLRYHRCTYCRTKFRSVEIAERDLATWQPVNLPGRNADG